MGNTIGAFGTNPDTLRRIDEIIEKAAEGLTDKEIAQYLKISKYTVDTYWKRLRHKLGVNNRTAAVIEYLRQKVEGQRIELEEANDALRQAYEGHRGGMADLLSTTQKQLTQCRTRSTDLCFHLGYYERATRMAHAVVYGLKSHTPVEHSYVSPSAVTFDHNPVAMKKSDTTFYDVIHEDDLPLLIESSLNATYVPNERYVFLYRLRMAAQEPRWVIDTHQASYDDDGTFISVIGLVLDVNDLVEAGTIKPGFSYNVLPAPPITHGGEPSPQSVD